MNTLQLILNWIRALFAKPITAPEPEPMPPLPPPPPPPPTPKYLWDTTDHIRHSVRVLCDEMGMSLEQKNTLTATINGESGFRLTAVNRNYYASGPKQGQLFSTDWGICQWNDYYHGTEITPDESLHNPEKAVRLMGKYWKMGEKYRTMWIAYANGSYKKYL